MYIFIITNDDRKRQVVFSITKLIEGQYVIYKNCKGLKVVLYSTSRKTIYIQDQDLDLVDDKFIFDYSTTKDVECFDSILLFFDEK